MTRRHGSVAVAAAALVVLLWSGFRADRPAAGPEAVRSDTVRAARSVAVTIDDLPVVRGGTPERMQRITEDLLDHLNRYGIPAIGFVNEVNLGEPEQPERVALLEQWLEHGMDLGNHTYSHPSLFTTPLGSFQADVVRGEHVTARLLAERGRSLRYFRHPYLNTGPDRQTRAAFETFLADRGYTVAPVTIDNDEWIYAFAYDKAEEAGDTALMRRIGKDYVRYMEEVFGFYEQLSQDLLGYEPPQVLLIHANALNAAYLDELAEMMRSRGYAFVSLDDALRDPAYALPDEYVGQYGISWLTRWWLTRGNKRRAEPSGSEWVERIAYPERG